MIYDPKEKKNWFDGSWVGEGIDFDEQEGEFVNFMSLSLLIKWNTIIVGYFAYIKKF